MPLPSTYRSLPSAMRAEIDAMLAPIRAGAKPLVLLLLFGFGAGDDVRELYQRSIARLFHRACSRACGTATLAVKVHPTPSGEQERIFTEWLKTNVPAQIHEIRHRLNLEFMLPQLQPGLCHGRALRQLADRERPSRRPRNHARRAFGRLSRRTSDGAAMGAAVSPGHRGLVAAGRMDLQRLRENTAVAWSRRASAADFVRRMALLYSDKLPATLKPREWTIRFRYPDPIGRVRLHLRSNNGADAFVHSEVFEHQYYRLPLRFAPATILDLGANIGLSTIYFARRYPGSRLACVEPVPENVRLLIRNLKDNAVEAEVIAAAIDAKDGVVAMERGAADYGHKIAAASAIDRFA